RDIAARPSETGDDAGAKGIAADGEHDRDGRRRLFGSEASGCAGGHDDVDAMHHQGRSETGEAIGLSLRIAVFGRDGLTLDISQLAHAAPVLLEVVLRSG